MFERGGAHKPIHQPDNYHLKVVIRTISGFRLAVDVYSIANAVIARRVKRRRPASRATATPRDPRAETRHIPHEADGAAETDVATAKMSHRQPSQRHHRKLRHRGLGREAAFPGALLGRSGQLGTDGGTEESNRPENHSPSQAAPGEAGSLDHLCLQSRETRRAVHGTRDAQRPLPDPFLPHEHCRATAHGIRTPEGVAELFHRRRVSVLC